jgi:hypothetical protein
MNDMERHRLDRVAEGMRPSARFTGRWLGVGLAGWLVVAALAAWDRVGQMARADDYDLAIASLQQTEESNASNQRAVEAARQLQGARPAVLLRVLEGMKRATPVGRNYLSGVAGTLFQRDSIYLRSQLESFLLDTTQDGEARYLVFEWLTEGQEALRDQMLDGFRDDPSLELRYAAIGRAIDRLDKNPELAVLRKLLDQSRHPSQIETLAKKLKESGETVDQAKVFGFLMTWDVIGPFDNHEQKHFHTVYPVERDLLDKPFDPSQKYSGKSGEVGWQSITTEEATGIVDLAESFNKEKGAIVYARTVFRCEQPQEVEVRLGCINANKLWVNGQEVFTHEVYHAGMSIDQYIGSVKMKAGDNEIVLKICQNEQTESWAQRWQFQLRISDATGKAVLAQNR